MRKLFFGGVLVFLFACEGEQGEIGLKGSNSLLNLTKVPAGESCSSGGYKIETGIDDDNNGILNSDEVHSTQYICNGIEGSDGLNSLTNITEVQAGDNCSTGGYKIEVGIDTNENGILDDDEIQSTQYICNGTEGSDGLNSLTNIIEEQAGDNCSAGGYKIEVGIDINENRVLDNDEIQSTQYICNGGYDNEIRFDFDWPFFGSLSTTSTAGSLNDIKTTLINFNINNYSGVDSVAFGAFLYTSNVSTKCIVELYNKTDNEVIVGSEVTTSVTSEVFVSTSSNFLYDIPQKNIDLGIRVRTETEGVYVVLSKPLLFLYRNK